MGAAMHTYDGCSIEWTSHYDQVTIVLDGLLRIVTGDNYSRVIEAKCGDFIRLPNGTSLKYEGEKAKTFTAVYPIDWRTRAEPVPTGTMPEILHLKSQGMVFEAITPEAGGCASTCQLLTSENSKTIGAAMQTYDGCVIEWTTQGDQVIVVLDGLFRILTGVNYSRMIEAKSGDFIFLPKGTSLKCEGEKAKTFTALYPVDGASTVVR